MRRVLLAVACLCLIGPGFGCRESDTSPKAAAKGRLFGVSFQTMNNPFFVDLTRASNRSSDAHGDRLVTLDAQFNSLKQKNDVSDLILQGAAAVFINPVNWEGVKGSLLQAQEKNVPCMIVDAPAKDMELVLCTVASDNVEAGRLAARALAAVRPNAKVVILHHSVNKACIDRVAGFQGGIGEAPWHENPGYSGRQGNHRGRPAGDARLPGTLPGA